jgi:serine/threonine protein kinase
LSTYRVDRELGRGGMAVVYAGWHEQLERPVALKVLAPHLAGDEHFRTRFLREARIASKLHHPNLVRTYDIAELDGSPCIVMELLPGGTLEGGPLTRPAAASIASGLAHAHAQGVVHRDLKPANLLRAADGVVKIADFGIARAVEETRVTQIGTVLGTLRYLAPEQAEGREVGPEADVYSLGVVLDELVASPSRADRALIERCLQPDPRDRPTAHEVEAALRDESTIVGPTQVKVSPARKVSHAGWGRARVGVVIAVLALAAVAAAIALTRGNGPQRVEPVRHATTPAQQARNLGAWLNDNSR